MRENPFICQAERDNHLERAFEDNPFIRQAERKNRLERAFEIFHAENPHIYDELARLARLGKQAGAKKLGIGQLFEVLRWQHLIETNATDFKLNNNLRAYYARALMENEEDLQGIFETRKVGY